MTEEQIQILINDYDISNEFTPSIHFCDGFEQSFVTADGDRFYISCEMYKIFERIFESFIDQHGFDQQRMEQDLNSILKLYPDSKEYKLSIYKNKLEQEHEKLKKVIQETDYINNVDNIKSLWFFDFFEHGSEIVECLKFDFLSGNKLSEFGMPFEVDLPAIGRQKLDRFYETDKMFKIYKVVEIQDNINYLIELINKLELSKEIEIETKSTENTVTHRQTAWVHYYKEKAQHSNAITINDIKKNGGNKNREKAFYSIGYFGKTSKAYKPPTAKELEKIIPLLIDFPAAKIIAENDLLNLQNS